MKKLIFIFTIAFLQISLYSQTEEIVPKQIDFGIFAETDYITAPSVSFDGKYFAFVVVNPSGYKMYECKINNGIFSTPKEIEVATLFFGENTYKNAPVYNYDASKIYFSANKDGNNDIFVIKRTSEGAWSEPEALPATINTTENENEPSISADNNTLYFVRFQNVKDPECGTIYVARKDYNHKWKKAVKLIKPLNDGCECTPRILSDNKTLMFASKREKDKSFKIYFTKNPYGDVWYLPKKIGEMSKYNELYPTTDYKGNTTYFTIDRRRTKTSKIYSFETPLSAKPLEMKILTGKVTDKNNKAIKAHIDLLNPYSLISTGLYNNKADGSYQIFVKPNSNLLIDYSGDNMSHQFVEYDNSELETTLDTVNSVLFGTVDLFLKIYDKDIYEPIDANVKVIEQSTGTEISCPTKKVAAGRYTVKIPIGKVYSIVIESEFTKPFTLEFDLSGVVVYQNYVKNIEVESEKVAYTFNITDAGTKAGINCQITLTNMKSKQKITTTATTDEKGNVTIFARKGDYYSVSVNPRGYTFFNTKIDVKDDKPKKIKVKLKKFKKDMTMGLKNITFETNSADLNEVSYAELGRVVDMMNKNPNIKVEISAHTDDIGSDAYNLLLSDRRAKSVVSYLQKKKIDIKRMIFKGYGETKPLVPNNSKENRAKNRRVELKITDLN